MIGNSWPETIFIRSVIYGFRLITPLCAAYCALRPFFALSTRAAILGIWPLAETVFWLFVYLPLRDRSQRKAIHPPLPHREGRRKLAAKCQETIRDPEAYLRRWCNDAPMSEIKRENVKQFLTWAFFNSDKIAPKDDPELDEYADDMETTLGRKFEPGWGTAKCIRLTLDPVKMMHRPLVWYMIVSLVDTVGCLRLYYHGFRLYRPAVGILPRTFPLRPLTLLSQRKSPAPTLSYWHQPHESRRRLPILFLHGIGIGLDTYVSFLSELRKQSRSAGDGEVGIIAAEVLPISFRITDAMLTSDETCLQLRQILQQHGFEKVVLVSHSYGTVMTTNVLKHPEISHMIDSVVLIDPVSILLHLPDVAYNFTRRKPRDANEHQLYYFASMDVGVSHTLARGFFWAENILWKEDLGKRPLTVSLAGKDLIVNTPAIADYLTDGASGWSDNVYDDRGHSRKVWANNGLRVLWHGDMDHASIFDRPGARHALVQDILGHTWQDEDDT